MARRSALSQQLDESQKSLAQLQAATVQYDAIARKVQELEANYKTYAQKRDESQMADAMDQQKLLNVSIAEPPTLSLIPVRPKPLLNLTLGMFTAFFLGACAVFFAEMMRDTAFTPKELEAFTQLPVLASIPVQSFPGRIGSRRLAGDCFGGRGRNTAGLLGASRNSSRQWRPEASAE
jgi:capsular polysaccharide biosynthesis protein